MLVLGAMRGNRSGWKGRAAQGAMVSLIVAGVACSAGGVDDPVEIVAPQDPGTGAQLPPGSSGTSNGGPVGPTPTPDAGKKETSVDAGPPPPVSGTSCPTVDEIREKQCGACGKQSTICQTQPD